MSRVRTSRSPSKFYLKIVLKNRPVGAHNWVIRCYKTITRIMYHPFLCSRHKLSCFSLYPSLPPSPLGVFSFKKKYFFDSFISSSVFLFLCLIVAFFSWIVFLFHESISYYCFVFLAVSAICSYSMCFTIDDDWKSLGNNPRKKKKKLNLLIEKRYATVENKMPS